MSLQSPGREGDQPAPQAPAENLPAVTLVTADAGQGTEGEVTHAASSPFPIPRRPLCSGERSVNTSPHRSEKHALRSCDPRHTTCRCSSAFCKLPGFMTVTNVAVLGFTDPHARAAVLSRAVRVRARTLCSDAVLESRAVASCGLPHAGRGVQPPLRAAQAAFPSQEPLRPLGRDACATGNAAIPGASL